MGRWNGTAVALLAGVVAIGVGGADADDEPPVSQPIGMLGSCPWRHGGTVNAMAFSEDGREIAIAEGPGNVRILSVPDGAERAGFPAIGHESESFWFLTRVMDVRHVKDRGWLAFRPEPGVLERLDGTKVEQSKLPERPKGEKGRIAALSPDGGLVAVAGRGSDLVVVNVSDGTERGGFRVEAPVVALRFSPRGRWLAASLEKRDLVVFDVGTGAKALQTPIGTRADSFVGFGAMAFDAEEGRLACAKSKGLWVLSVPDGRVLRETAKDDEPRSVALSPRGDAVVYGTLQGALVFEPLVEGKAARRLPSAHQDLVWQVAFAPSGSIVASASRDGRLGLWTPEGDVAPGFPAATCHEASVVALAASPDGRFLVSGGHDGTARRWDVGTRAALPDVGEFKGTAVKAVTVSEDGRRVAVGTWDGRVLVAEGEVGSAATLVRRGTLPIMGLRFVGPNGLLFAEAGGTVLQADLGGRAPERRLAEQGNTPMDAFDASADAATWVGVLRRVNSLVIVENRTGGGRREIPAKGSLDCCAVSKDGKWAAAGGGDWLVYLTPVAPGGKVRTLGGHKDVITSLAFSPDGRLLASGGTDRTIRLWDVVDGRPLRVLHGHRGAVRSLAFLPTTGLLASGGDDTQVLLWDVGAASAPELKKR